jgi:hypothetical protein
MLQCTPVQQYYDNLKKKAKRKERKAKFKLGSYRKDQ